MEDKTILSLAAIFSIIILDLGAMFFLHIDGVLMTMCVGAISGLCGYNIKEFVQKERETKISYYNHRDE